MTGEGLQPGKRKGKVKALLGKVFKHNKVATSAPEKARFPPWIPFMV